WVLWHKENPLRKDLFDWRAAAGTLHVPMIKALFEQVATPSKLGPLGLVEPLDWTAAALNRVDRPEFFARFVEEQAVQYFYEPFLEAFDPELRKELGVWYTPPEIVRYMVARVDTVLRDELDVPDGLADPRVYVLDPCCGTGAYLVEVLRRIVRTLKEDKGEGALALVEAKQAAMKRVCGFEIMPAPFVVAHLQMGLLLQNFGAPLQESAGERAGIFLTNALTGWDFAGENPHLADWPELEAERKGAGIVKTDKPILVILGNPPYNAYAGVSPQEEQGLVEPYKDGLIKDWGIRKFNLDDLYIRFFRIAERKIAEKTGKGIVCYISNFSYLSDPSFVVMRKRLLKEFDVHWFDCLNGDSRETGKLTPDGKPDPSVFSTDSNREGIRVGTAVGLMLRKATRAKTAKVFYRDFWGVNKRSDILESLKVSMFEKEYGGAKPEAANRFSFRPAQVACGYLSWAKVVEFAGEAPISGLQEMRHGSLMAYDSSTLRERMEIFFDEKLDWETVRRLGAGPITDGGGFVAKEARAKLLKTESFTAKAIIRYALYPFDVRWAYYSDATPLWNRPRPNLVAQQWRGNEFFLTRMFAERPTEQVPFIVTKALPDYHLLRPNAVAIPFRLRATMKPKPKKDDGNGQFDTILREAAPDYDGGSGKTTANLSPAARAYLAKLGVKDPDMDADTAALIWLHALAIGYAPAYLAENTDGIRQDWPRIPLPDTKAGLLASAVLGRQVADLLDTESPLPGVTSGKLHSELKSIAELHAHGDVDFRLTAGWGHAGKGGITMPGKGKLETRAEAASTTGDLPWFEFHDVFLNETACWRNIPKEVWDYTIGGYQVIKKWLSYREHELLGRPLTADE
ncbi:MAG: methyltransferase, partial [Acidobacteria bacterium]|nr:methyltransferase [Acidobacteriota bacterium]